MKIKKIMAVFMVFLVLSLLINTQAFAYSRANYNEFNEYKSKYRILYGAILIVGGGILAYDGFRTVKTNISKPSVGLNFSSFWYKSADDFNYIIESAGTIVNTGNVDLRNVNVWVRYRIKDQSYRPSVFGTQIKYEGNSLEGPLENLTINELKSWSSTINYLSSGANPPEGAETDKDKLADPNYVYRNATYPSSTPAELVDIVSIEYDYTKKYKDEMNNAYEGLLGLLLIAGGAYILIDYIASLKRFDYYMKKNNMDVYVTNIGEEFKLMLSKRI